MHILFPWPELRLFAPHVKSKLVSTYPREFSSQGHDSSDPTFKNLLDQQSIRLSLSSVLYTSKILLLYSTWSQSLGSTVLSCSPTHSYASSGDCVTDCATGYWCGELSKTTNYPDTWKSLSTVGKMEKPHCVVPGPSAFMETWSGTPASCSLQQWYCWASWCSFLNSTGMSLTPQRARSGAQPVVTNPIEKWIPSWTGSPGCLVRASANSVANDHW